MERVNIFKNEMKENMFLKCFEINKYLSAYVYINSFPIRKHLVRNEKFIQIDTQLINLYLEK